MIIKRQQFPILCISISSALFSACSGDNRDLINYINDIKARPVRSIEPIPQFIHLPIFKFPEYDEQRDPFKPKEQKERVDLAAPDQTRTKQPLEEFPLDSLKLVGTLKQGTMVWALIRQPDRQISQIKMGEYMGQNYGRVVLIKNDLLCLEETIKNSGKWEKHITRINM